VPVHWGTVNLRLGPPSMPMRRLVKVAAERGVDRLVRVLAHGATFGSASSAEVVVNDADRREHGDRDADDVPEDAVADGRITGVELHRPS
jgi:hypothetical protein